MENTKCMRPAVRDIDDRSVSIRLGVCRWHTDIVADTTAAMAAASATRCGCAADAVWWGFNDTLH